MAFWGTFWGIELMPEKPFQLKFEDLEGRRLHVSQATLGLEPTGKRTLVKCKVADGPEILICSLIPGVAESCPLDLFFCDDCIFSVVGSATVHLSGYYDADCCQQSSDGDDSLDESEDGYMFSDEDDYDSSDDENVLSQFPSSVKIEEVIDEEPLKATASGEKAADANGSTKKRKKQQKDTAKASNDLKLIKDDEMEEKKGDGRYKQDSKMAVGSDDEQLEESEDEDRSVITVKRKSEISKESEDEDGFAYTTKRKSETSSTSQSLNKSQAAEESGDAEPELTTAQGSTPVLTDGKKKKRKKKDKKAKKNIATETPNQDEGKGEIHLVPGQSPLTNKVAISEVKTPGKKGVPSVRKYPNGLEVEEVEMGKPDGKQAVPGKKIEMLYTGKLKSNGKIFDSNVGKKPFQFRLGVGDVIKGWDVGVNGMRVGDKRRLTIPPAMGYGPKGVPGIPPNSWLVFDIELVNVK